MIYNASGERNYIDIFHLLLQCGADPNLPAAKNESWSTYRFLVYWRNIKEIHHAVDPWVVSLVEEFGGTAHFIILYCFPEYTYTG